MYFILYLFFLEILNYFILQIKFYLRTIILENCKKEYITICVLELLTNYNIFKCHQIMGNLTI